MKYKKLTKDFLYKEYIIKNKSLYKISKDIGCGKTTIRSWIIKYNIGLKNNTNYKKDLTGMIFGDLTVLNHIYDKNINKWLCVCKCGKKLKLVTTLLIVKKQKRCVQCNNKININNKYRWLGYKEISQTYWGTIIYGAKSRNLKFNITIQYVWKLFLKQNKKCALSGLNIIFAESRKSILKQTASLDRIDSSKGYIKGNVQWIHKDINRMKGNLSENKFLNYCKLISDICYNNLITGGADC